MISPILLHPKEQTSDFARILHAFHIAVHHVHSMEQVEQFLFMHLLNMNWQYVTMVVTEQHDSMDLLYVHMSRVQSPSCAHPVHSPQCH